MYYLVKSLSTVLCSLQPDTGSCKASFLSYYWNINTRQCERFIYGGCGGNYNRFLDVISCANQCGKYVNKMLSVATYILYFASMGPNTFEST